MTFVWQTDKVGKVEQTNVYFWKGGSFGAVQVEKVESLGAAQAEKWGGGGFRAAHTLTALIWEYPPPPPPPHTHREDQNERKIINKWPLFDRQTDTHTQRETEKKEKRRKTH